MRAQQLHRAVVVFFIVTTRFTAQQLAEQHQTLMQALPTLWKEKLITYHAEVKGRAGAGGHQDANDLWTPDEDASILEQRHGRVKSVSWKKVAVGERSEDAIRNRHRKHLVPNVVEKTVPWDEAGPCMAVICDDDYGALAERLHATGNQLPLHVQNGLLSMHADKEQRMQHGRFYTLVHEREARYFRPGHVHVVALRPRREAAAPAS